MFLPTSIDLKHPENYILTLRVSLGHFMFMFSEKDGEKRCLSLKETAFDSSMSQYENIKKIFLDLPLLTLPFHQAIVIWVDSSYNIVPEYVLDKMNKNELFYITNNSKEDTVICSNDLSNNSLKVLVGMDKDIHGFLIRNMCQPIFYSHASLLIELFERKLQPQGGYMILNIHSGCADIIVFREDKLIASQTYYGWEEEDLLYYALKFWEVAGFNQFEDRFYHNNLSIDSVTKLKDYVRCVESFVLPSEIHLWNKEIQGAPLDMISLFV